MTLPTFSNVDDLSARFPRGAAVAHLGIELVPGQEAEVDWYGIVSDYTDHEGEDAVVVDRGTSFDSGNSGLFEADPDRLRLVVIPAPDPAPKCSICRIHVYRSGSKWFSVIGNVGCHTESGDHEVIR